MTRPILALALALALSGCAGFNAGYEAHVLDMDKDIGSTEIVRQGERGALIYWMRYDQANEHCREFMPYTDAQSCMNWLADGWEIFPGIHCIGFVVPNKSIAEHEFRRCFDPDYEVGIMNKVKI